MRPIGRKDTIEAFALGDTVLDPTISGRTICIGVDRFAGGAVPADDGVRVHKCRVHPSVRRGLGRDSSGRVVMNPLLRAADNLVGAVCSQDAGQVRRSSLAFFNTRCSEMSRDLASRNPALAVLHGSTDSSAVQRLVNLAPEYRPLEFVAAMMAAAKQKSTLSYDLVTVTAGNARTLAEVFRNTLFPQL